jgi:DNA replication protein
MEKAMLMKWLGSGSLSVPNLLLLHYKHIKLNEKETMLLIQIHSYIESGHVFPTPEELTARMTITFEECCELLRKLIQKGVLLIEDLEDIKGVRNEGYSLLPLWEKLYTFLLDEEQQQIEVNEKMEEESLYTVFEREFGRPLSPMECETLGMWIDQDNHPTVLIQSALREAVVSGKMNFRYIDRILFEWKRNGVKTIEQAKEYGKKFRSYKKQPEQHVVQEQQKSESKSTPFYHWLEKP